MNMNGSVHMNGAASRTRDDRVERNPRFAGAPRATSRGLWPGVIFLLLGMNVCIVAITVFAATRGRAAAIEPNYYERAVHWDDSARELERSRLLGWTVEVRLSPSGAGPTDLTVNARDSTTAPVEGAAIVASMFHHARPGEVTEVVLSPVGGGVYKAALPAAAAGLWRVNLSISRGADRWSRDIDLEYNRTSGGVACSR